MNSEAQASGSESSRNFRLESPAWFWLPVLLNLGLFGVSMVDLRISNPFPEAPSFSQFYGNLALPYFGLVLMIGRRRQQGLTVVDFLWLLLGQLGLEIILWRMMRAW